MAVGFYTRQAWNSGRAADQHNDFFTRNILVTCDPYGSSTAAADALAERNRSRSNVPWCPWPDYGDVVQWAHAEGVAAAMGLDGTSNTPALQMALMAALDDISEDTCLPYLEVDEAGELVVDGAGDPVVATVPPKVHLAAVIHATRLYGRRKSQDGTLGASAFGGAVRVSKYDPDVRALLGNYLRKGVA